ncbi:hypothetical protein GGX14DRAFT_395323 [Mycena pura]|uniref:Uncharacterized protein n=1 Tax=Mycena pura TaxID=153505 RepID=A0AAD6VK13_9AGAR|nr:hypothetical protein GGX14DRAFT_395323 [Mycena pura]
MAKSSSILFLLCAALCAAAGGIHGRHSGDASCDSLRACDFQRFKVIFELSAAQAGHRQIQATVHGGHFCSNLTARTILAVAGADLDSAHDARQVILGSVVNNLTVPADVQKAGVFALQLAQFQLTLLNGNGTHSDVNDTLLQEVQSHLAGALEASNFVVANCAGV